MDDKKLKSFWERPEGKTGTIVAGLLGTAGLIGLYKILPWLITLAQNTLHLMFLLGSIGAIIYILTDSRFRTMVGYFYKTVMRYLTGLVIQLDPIAILKSYLRELRSNLENMEKQIANLRGTMRSLKAKIQENTQSMENSLSMAQQAKKQGQNKILVLKARKASRLKESNLTLQELYVKMESIYRVLSKMQENCTILYDDTKDQIELKEAEWKAIKQANSAMKSAMSMIHGKGDKRAVYEQALEFIADDLGNKIGEMERFMEVSEDFMAGIDLQNGVFDEKGLKMLEEWEQKADSLILGNDKEVLLLEARNEKNVLDVERLPEKILVKRENNQFDKFFN